GVGVVVMVSVGDCVRVGVKVFVGLGVSVGSPFDPDTDPTPVLITSVINANTKATTILPLVRFIYPPVICQPPPHKKHLSLFNIF
ncbi:MAG: hypothetical protein ACD_24C00092G0001, partial [uncultured bacterium]